ncbi:MAG TPA: 4Fe-4S dicluster domain-containing protein [Phycisphaerae bacterium]|nr:4Fe-4S dicluster domain-containing protein [Phycisphaerae bacterium]
MSDGNKDEREQSRRGFFRESIFGIVRPAANYLEKKLPPALRAPSTSLPVLLRPPGAMAEREFLDTCLRCGRCADVCPADAISLVSGKALLNAEAKARAGTPFINPSERACVMCDDLSCMKVCPSGALKLVDRLAIRVGIAVVDHSICVRSSGENCTICVDVCPLGKQAIGVSANGQIDVIDPSCTGAGCTGCGLCQERCPTRPVRAIRVRAYPGRIEP